MADTKLSALNELAATPAVDDEIYIRDISEDPANESKRITVANVMAAKAMAPIFAPAWGSTMVGYGDGRAARLGNGDFARCSFRIPANWTSTTSVHFIIINDTTDGTSDLDIYSDYAADGELYYTHSESDLATTYNMTEDLNYLLDASGILSAEAAGDIVGLMLKNNAAGDFIYVFGVYFVYA
jgi:hypothetical protein